MAWTFRYTRADEREIELKPPFETEEEAREGMRKMTEMGAICTGPYRIEEEAPAKTAIERFKRYLSLELKVLEDPSINYWIFYEYLKSMILRLKINIIANNRNEEASAEMASRNNSYLQETADYLETKSKSYDPLDGSAWESVGEELLALAEIVRTGKIMEEQITFRQQ